MLRKQLTKLQVLKHLVAYFCFWSLNLSIQLIRIHTKLTNHTNRGWGELERQLDQLYGCGWEATTPPTKGEGVYILHSQKLAVMSVKVRDSLKKCITYVLEQKLPDETEKTSCWTWLCLTYAQVNNLRNWIEQPRSLCKIVAESI